MTNSCTVCGYSSVGNNGVVVVAVAAEEILATGADGTEATPGTEATAGVADDGADGC